MITMQGSLVTLEPLDVLYADVWEGNINSAKSLESYGYRLLETTHGIFPKTGTDRKRYLYSFSKQDYLALKSAT